MLLRNWKKKKKKEVFALAGGGGEFLDLETLFNLLCPTVCSPELLLRGPTMLWPLPAALLLNFSTLDTPPAAYEVALPPASLSSCAARVNLNYCKLNQ